MDNIRQQLVTALPLLADAGQAADHQLVAAEQAQALRPSRDEQALQALGALSREIWTAHKATLTAIAATRQYEGLEQR